MAVDPLLKELNSRGVVDAATLGWARAYQAKEKLSLDSALLLLDVIEEEQLTSSLESTYAMAGASRQDLLDLDPSVAEVLPLKAARSFGLVPVRREGKMIAAFVARPLETATLDRLRDLYDVHLQQLIAPSHYVAVALHEVYGAEVDEMTRKLELRLSRRHDVGDVRATLERLSHAKGLHDAVREVLRAAGARLDFCAFFLRGRETMRIAAYSGEAARARESLPKPEMVSALGAAIAHGAYFFGPLQGVLGETTFYERLGRDTPRWAYVAPVPAAPGVVFYGDNAERAIPQRWVAELTLLVARMGQHQGTWKKPFPEPQVQWEPIAKKSRAKADAAPAPVVAPTHVEAALPATTAPSGTGDLEAALAALEAFSSDGGASSNDSAISLPDVAPSTPAVAPPAAPTADAAPSTPNAIAAAATAVSGISRGEAEALAKLRVAAEEDGLSVGALVDKLLMSHRGSPAAPAQKEEPPAIAGEVKDLFEKLATDIPAHFARGMEAAFRDLVPRIAAGPPVAMMPGAGAMHAPRASAASAANIEIVMTEAKPREVESYQDKRKKAKRIKL